MHPLFRLVLVLVAFPLFLASVVACDDDDDPVTPPDPGSIDGIVLDEEGQGLSGTGLLLTRSGESDQNATSGTDGTFSFTGLTPGSWMLAVTPPTGYEAAPNQSLSVQVDVPEGAAAEVTINLQSEESNGNGENGENGEVEEIQLTTALTFSPDDVTIEPGTTIRWVNAGNVFHTVTPDGHSEWNEAELSSQGDTFEHTFETEGVFEYYCAPHLDDGMTGTIRVESGGNGGQDNVQEEDNDNSGGEDGDDSEY